MVRSTTRCFSRYPPICLISINGTSTVHIQDVENHKKLHRKEQQNLKFAKIRAADFGLPPDDIEETTGAYPLTVAKATLSSALGSLLVQVTRLPGTAPSEL